MANSTANAWIINLIQDDLFSSTLDKMIITDESTFLRTGESLVSEILQTLSNVKPELNAKYNVCTIGLFGLATRNDFASNSDIDLIVEFSDPIGIEFINLANYFEGALRRKAD